MEVDFQMVSPGVTGGGIKPGQDVMSMVQAPASVMVMDKNPQRPIGADRSHVEPWSVDEDQKLLQCVSELGATNWSQISEQLHGRSAMHCRQRWVTQVDPSIVKSPWTEDEDRKIVVAQRKLGNRFAEIAKVLDGRPRPAVCQRWHSVLHGRAEKMLESMTKEEIQQIADSLQLDEAEMNPSQDKKRWTAEEDQALQEAVNQLGTSNWGEISRRMPTRRSSIQCRRRFTNKLDPNVKNDEWTEEEDKKIVAAQSRLGNRWAQISKLLEGRSEDAVGHRWMSMLHARADRIKQTLTENDWKFLQNANDIPYRNVKPWTVDEDEKLINAAKEHGTANWALVSKLFQGRSSRQCRDRYFSKLDPSISKEPWGEEEDKKIVIAQSKLGNSWVKIAKYLEGRPEIAVKVRWYTVLSQKADKMLTEMSSEDYKFIDMVSIEAQKAPEKRKWSEMEDQKLVSLVGEYGLGNWSQIATQLQGRSCLQCRNRYVNQVDPSLRRGGWTEEEDKKVVAAQSRLGNSWAKISRLMDGRSESALNGRWYSVLEPRAASILAELKPEDFLFLDETQLPPKPIMQGNSGAYDRRQWTEQEDQILLEMVNKLGTKSWAEIAKQCPGRAPKQCRHRYLNKVDPKRNIDAWTDEEDKKVVAAQMKLGNRFAEIAKLLDGRTESVVSHRWHVNLQPRAERIQATLTDKDFEFVLPVAAAQNGGVGVQERRGWKPWTPEEDAELIRLVEEHGKHNWPHVSRNMASSRLPKQCRDRYINKLDPNIRKDAWTDDEDKKIVAAQSKLGNRWAKISKYLDGRSETAIKSRWYQSLQPRSDEILRMLEKNEFSFLEGVDDSDKNSAAAKDRLKKKVPTMPGQKKDDVLPGAPISSSSVSVVQPVGVGMVGVVGVGQSDLSKAAEQMKVGLPPPPGGVQGV
jgi:hypothetical protein